MPEQLPDFRTLFEGAPDLYLIVRPDPAYPIVAANDAYLRASLTTREEILGRSLFEVFPDNPAAPAAASGVTALRGSLDAVLATRERQYLQLQRYDIRRPGAATQFEERYWRVCNVPILSADGAIDAILHRVEDITEQVLLERTAEANRRAQEQQRLQAAQTGQEMARRTRELQETSEELRDSRAQLRDAQSRLNVALKAANVATWVWEPNTDRISGDVNLVQWYHVAPDEAREARLDSYLAAVHPDDLGALRRVIDDALQRDVPLQLEYRIRRGGEAEGWRRVLARGWVERDAAGRAQRVVGVTLDVTEAREAVEALTETQQQLDLAMEAAEIGSFYCPVPLHELRCNPRCREHLGLDGQSGLDFDRFYALIHDDERDRVREDVGRAMRGEGDFDIEFRVLAAGSPVRWLHAKGRAYFDAAGQPTRFAGVTIDVSRQKQIEQELRAGEARYRLLVESLQDYAIFLLDDDGIVTSWNIGAQRMLGYSEEEILGRPSDIIFTPEDQAAGAPVKERTTAQSGKPAMDDRWHVRKDGTRFFVTGMLEPLLDEQGRRVGLVKIMRDITDRQLAVAERELLLESERAARAEAERNSQLKDEFLATLSHELRTPLNAILGWTQVLQMGPADPEELAQGLDVIDRNTRVQAQLIDDLLDMSRIVSGKLRLDVQRLPIAGPIEAAIDSVRPAAAAKHIALNASFPGGGGNLIVMADKNRLQQVVWNLLSNAIKFTPMNGTVEVRAARAGDQVEVSVADNGIGISPEFLPYVFERFRQADASTTRHHGGLGLGLSIVKQLIELQGGDVHAQSGGPGTGARFTFRLPLAQAADEAALAAPAPQVTRRPPVTDTDDPPLHGVKVLAVDDEPDSVRLVQRLLQGVGAVVATAGSMEEALNVLPAFRPHVLVSDIGMPEHDGYELMRRIRSHPDWSTLPAAALTALVRPADRTRALRAGFQTHVCKPIEAPELIAVVMSLAALRRTNRP